MTLCDVVGQKSEIKKRVSRSTFCALSDEHKKWGGQIFSPQKLVNFILTFSDILLFYFVIFVDSCSSVTFIFKLVLSVNKRGFFGCPIPENSIYPLSKKINCKRMIEQLSQLI